jgi:hypothetical protein
MLGTAPGCYSAPRMFRASISQQILYAPLKPVHFHAKRISRISGLLLIRRNFTMSPPLQEGAAPKNRTRKRLIILCDG